VKLKNGNWLSVQGSGIGEVLKSLQRLGITADAEGNLGRISFAQLASLEAAKEAELRTETGAATALAKIHQLLENFETSAKPHKSLQAKLRHYQLEGFQFLLHLHRSEVGGILADDMGLGKTVQAITVMNAISFGADGAKRNRFLVVCPLAALGVWEGEIQKFSPNLSVYRWHGAERSYKEALGSDVGDHDLRYVHTRCGEVCRG
jgi:SNF2 family DNA or RNA helicase